MPKIIQINGKVNLIKNHVKIKTVSHCPWLRSFCSSWGLGRKIVEMERYSMNFSSFIELKTKSC